MTYPTVAQHIREKRIAAHLTQTQAANLVHVSLRTWQDYEAGKNMHEGLLELFNIKVSKHG